MLVHSISSALLRMQDRGLLDLLGIVKGVVLQLD
jgi:hypothetical protein